MRQVSELTFDVWHAIRHGFQPFKIATLKYSRTSVNVSRDSRHSDLPVLVPGRVSRGVSQHRLLSSRKAVSGVFEFQYRAAFDRKTSLVYTHPNHRCRVGTRLMRSRKTFRATAAVTRLYTRRVGRGSAFHWLLRSICRERGAHDVFRKKTAATNMQS